MSFWSRAAVAAISLYFQSGPVVSVSATAVYVVAAHWSFVRTFTIADHVEVKEASVSNGILTIALEHVIPEEKKAKKIAIEYKG